MSRFETPGQVVLLFAGAALVSVVLIALLNAEARSRKLKDPEIENDTVFTVLGRRIAQLAQKLRQPQLNRSRRSLQSVGIEEDDEPHPVRHHGKHSRVHRNSTPSPPPATAPVTTSATTVLTTTAPVSRRLPAPHDACYSTHEVLLIIGLTCAVNFAFIFVIMAMVHLCNRSSSSSSSSKSACLPGLDSLDIPEECLTRHAIVRSASCNGVQEYINNLPPIRTPSLTSLQSLARANPAPQMQPSFSMEDLLYAG